MFNEEKFSKWLETGLQTMKDENAYCLNLYDEDDEWTCELVATNKFYKDGNDWCFDETKVYKREKPFVLTIFTATAALRNAPFGKNCACFYPDIKCYPCMKRKCKLKKDKNLCCSAVDAAVVIEKLSEILAL